MTSLIHHIFCIFPFLLMTTFTVNMITFSYSPKRSTEHLLRLWFDSNKLALNIEKANCMLFHFPWKKLTEHSNLKIGKKDIQRTKYVKFLGVLMDEHLTWKYHTTELCKKLFKTAGIFLKVRHYVPLPTLISLYNSMFLPFLNYSTSALGMTYESYLDPPFKLQKKILRCIKFEPFAFSSHQFSSY